VFVVVTTQLRLFFLLPTKNSKVSCLGNFSFSRLIDVRVFHIGFRRKKKKTKNIFRCLCACEWFLCLLWQKNHGIERFCSLSRTKKKRRNEINRRFLFRFSFLL